jgi:hypothetical protein
MMRSFPIRSRMMDRAQHVARMGQNKSEYRVLIWKPLDLLARILLKWIWNKWDWRLKIGHSGAFF